MAYGVTQDTSVLAVLKEYYGVQDVEALVFRNSPVLKMIRKERIGGKYIPLPMAAYGSGAVSADFNQVTQQAANSYTGVSMLVTPGRLFASFVLDPQEFLASQGDRAAFISVFALRAMLAMDDLRKVLASCLYHQGYLELGVVNAIDTTNYLYVDVDPSTAMAVDPGSVLQFAPTPTGAFRGGTVQAGPSFVVSSIAQQATGNTRITFAAAFGAGLGVTIGDWLLIKGGRDINAGPNAPAGFGAWLPSLYYRGANSAANLTAWNAYIGTSFFGVNRSSAPDRLAGQYIYRNVGANEPYTQAILRLVKQVRRGGGIVDLVIVNDDDFGFIMNEALANRTFYQEIQGGNSSGKNKVTQGIDQFQMNFSTSWINMVYDDPYCPKNTAYVLDTAAVRLFGLSNASPILENIPLNNAPGAPKASSQGEPTTNFQFLVDDMYTTSPIDLQSGKGLRVDFQFFGNFAIVAPAHCGCVTFN
jgi:hypothetical protein